MTGRVCSLGGDSLGAGSRCVRNPFFVWLDPGGAVFGVCVLDILSEKDGESGGSGVRSMFGRLTSTAAMLSNASLTSVQRKDVVS